MRNGKIKNTLFITNRKRLRKLIKPDSVAVFNSNDIMPTSADGTYPFKQNSDMFYLTGINQEESILMICPHFPDKRYQEILFIRQPNENLEKWEGHKLTTQEATKISGISAVLWLSDFDKWFHHLVSLINTKRVYLNSNEHYRAEIKVQSKDARFINWCKSKYPLHKYERVAPLMAKLRSVKQKEEIKLIQKAVQITEKGLLRVLKFVKPGVAEFEIEAEFIHEFIRNGSRGFGYSPIIASGKNNTVLHYVENNQVCRNGDLLLLDVGAEYGNYCADLTRTIPVGGRYSERQKEVYNSVLRILKESKKIMGTGIAYFDFHKEVEKLMERELLKLKLIDKTDIKNQTVGNEAFRRYYYHGTSHMLGLDVHDVGSMHHKMLLDSVWTIEPGIYIAEEGFGIRIENDVVIKKNGVVDLMEKTPIEVDEIEELMNS